MRLTKRMKELLEQADLVTFEINEVPMMTLWGLQSRGLVSSREPRSRVTGGHSFPWFRGVKLTEAGMRAARTLQGYKRGL